MKYKAVIFDLFGTLVCQATWAEQNNVLRQMASVLSVPPEDFIKQWIDTSGARIKGEFSDGQANIKYICQQLGVPSENNQIEFANQLRIDLVKRHLFNPKKDAIEVLSYLKSNSYKTGIISDCSSVVSVIWPDAPLATLIDVAIFSCLVGMQKPDPRIYRLAIEQLTVEPENCLYIGDGNSQELTGAAAVGMYPVLIRDPDEDSSDVYRFDYEAEEWDGPVISSLKEVLTLVK